MRRIKHYLLFVMAMFFFSDSSYARIYPVTDAECQIMAQQKVITADNPIPCTRLSRVTFPVIGFNGQLQEGELVVFDAVAENTQEIFLELFARGIPVNKAKKMEAYSGDDDASMRDNNTSAFNGRAITGGKKWSKHAYGMAIDINPLQNPWLGANEDNQQLLVKPAASIETYLNRNEHRPGRATRTGMAEEMIDVFYNNGFMIWGGEWDAPLDYQHFETGSMDFINELIALPADKAAKNFQSYVMAYRACLKEEADRSLVAINHCVVKVRK